MNRSPKYGASPCQHPVNSWYLAAVFNWDDYEDDAYFELEALGLPKSKDFLVHDFLDASIPWKGLTAV